MTENIAKDEAASRTTSKPSLKRNSWVLTCLTLAVILVWVLYRDQLTLENLADQELQLRSRFQSAPFVFFVGAFVLYVVVAGLALPGAAALSLAYAWFFGFWPAFVLISFASTLGATISFLLSRFFFGRAIQNRFGDRLRSINENFRKDGAFYLFSLRLIPAIPFFVVNLLMGLTSIRVWTYWWVSQIGMLPGTAVFVYAGASVPSLHTFVENGLGSILSPQIVVAFSVLGVFPFFVKKMMDHISRTRPPQNDQ